MKIKDLLAINLEQEIEAVIKVGSYDEKLATEEIKNYIVTDKIADYIEKFISDYKRREKETGVWLSGFYGSGKSYLAKILGYLLENPELQGVPARDLFKSRLEGLDDRYILENEIESLNNYQTKVVTFDLSGESKINSLFTQLLLNFLGSIGLSKDVYGYIEYQIMKTDQYERFLAKANELCDGNWPEQRNNKFQAPQIIKQAWVEVTDGDKEEVEAIMSEMHDRIKALDADTLVNELDAFLELDNNYDRVMFIVDEVSEALEKDHIDIAELRGAAQHLSENGRGKYWFLATSQEKLDNVLNKENINQNDINIITDRFQHKIHLSSAQVDKVIRERILAKSERGKEKLREFYENNEGLINNLSNLAGNFSTTSDSIEEFIDQYPFFNYQMRLLKNFLFSVFQQAKSGGSERGMLITVDRIIKQEAIPEKELGKFVTSYQLAEHGFPMPQSELVEKFEQAKSDLAEEEIEIDGKQLMQTIFFLEESEDLKRTVDNVTKAYNDDLTYIGDLKPKVEQALELLEKKNFVLEENGEYKITSDTEKKLMEEMNRIEANWEERKEIIRNMVKNLSFLSQAETVQVDGKTYQISLRDEQDTLLSRKKGEVKLLVYNLLAVDQDIDRFIEDKKETHLELDEAVLIPEPDDKDEIDKLIRKIYRFKQIISNYRNSTDEEIKDVIDSFSANLTNKEDQLEYKLRKSYQKSTIVYDYQEYQLDENNPLATITEVETTMINRSFSKRLETSLSDNTAVKILKADDHKLVNFGNDKEFNFFDNQGNFIGSNLMVAEEIKKECQEKNGRLGKGLLKEFTGKPYGWNYGDIIGTLAALIRAGNVKVKYNNQVYRDYQNDQLIEIFKSKNRFKKSKFSVMGGGGIPPKLKQKVVDRLLEIDTAGKVQVSYNDNDYKIIKAIKDTADQYHSQFGNLKKKVKEEIIDQNRDDIQVLKDFALSQIDDTDLKGEAKEFLNNREKFASAVEYITELNHFVEYKYQNYLNQIKFVKNVQQQIEIIDQASKENLEKEIKRYLNLKEKSVVNNINELTNLYQQLRQELNEVFKDYHQQQAEQAEKLLEAAKDKADKIEAVSLQANSEFYSQLENYISTCKQFLEGEFDLSDTEVKCTHCNSSLKEIVQGIELYESRIKQVKQEPIMEPNHNPGGGSDPDPKPVLPIKLKKKTDSVEEMEKQLKRALNSLDKEKYSGCKIELN